MTMSTYKSLGGPPGGLVVTNDAELAQRIDAIAYPGLTANFDAARTAALAVTMLDWKVAGPADAHTMTTTASRLAAELTALGIPVFASEKGATRSHQFAILAHRWDGGSGPPAGCARRTCWPAASACRSTRSTTTRTVCASARQVARLGMTDNDMPALAALIARGLDPDVDPSAVGAEVTAWRNQFSARICRRGWPRRGRRVWKTRASRPCS